MPFATINGQKIRFDDTGGSNPPVVLSHGFLMDRTMFAPQVAALKDKYRVITWDERGFGETEFDGKPFTYWDSARDLIGLLDHLGIDKAVIGGMSQGGFLSLRAALTAPERILGLILLDTQAGVEDEEKKVAYGQLIDGWAANGPVDEIANTVAFIIINDKVANEKWISIWRSRPKEGIIEPGRCLTGRDDITSRLGEIKVPALVVHGIDDTAITMDRAEILAEGLSGCDGVVKVAGAHAANLTNPEPVNEAILGFLKKVYK
ncbi:hydrolase, alpha/beta fold family [Hyaloraphidium curvatum]|nr:hydrolase, alpha/beta fold family [Hyaloraphidium curvatum]